MHTHSLASAENIVVDLQNQLLPNNDPLSLRFSKQQHVRALRV